MASETTRRRSQAEDDDQLPLIGRERALIDKLTDQVRSGIETKHELAPISPYSPGTRGNTFLVRMIEDDRKTRTGRIARVTVELEGLDEEPTS